jgi:Uma2 family endonuclease
MRQPELHLGDDILVPDIAGWRVERLPEIPDEAYLTLAPDWACEVLSPSTEAIDRADKAPIYAREGVPWLWMIDPDVRTFEVFQLDRDTYRVHAVDRDDAVVRAEPFDALELPLEALWGRRRLE